MPCRGERPCRPCCRHGARRLQPARRAGNAARAGGRPALPARDRAAGVQLGGGQPVRAASCIERDRVEAERVEDRVVGPARAATGALGRASTAPAAAQVLRGCRSTLSTSFAPCLISAWQPRDCGEWIEPGIANTSRPASCASRAVISEPDCSAASTTSVPRARPAMMRLRCGKVLRKRRRAERELADQQPMLGNATARAHDCDAGRRLSSPVPTTAIGAARAVEPALVRGCVDAERQARDDRQTGVAEVRREAPCVVESLRRRIAAADDRDRFGDSAARRGPGRRAAAAGRRLSSSDLRVARVAERDDRRALGTGSQPRRRVARRCTRAAPALPRRGGRRAFARGRRLRATAWASRSSEQARAASRPTPGVSSSRSQAASSSRSITVAAQRRRPTTTSGGLEADGRCESRAA